MIFNCNQVIFELNKIPYNNIQISQNLTNMSSFMEVLILLTQLKTNSNNLSQINLKLIVNYYKKYNIKIIKYFIENVILD